jgi:hypothetical protein
MSLVILPVITTSVRLVPKMRLLNLPLGASLPFPYDGKTGSEGHSDSSSQFWPKIIESNNLLMLNFVELTLEI